MIVSIPLLLKYKNLATLAYYEEYLVRYPLMQHQLEAVHC